MKKTYSVEKTHDNMRLDRWIRNKIGKIPQGLIEKNLRNGKIKLNNKKVKSKHKVKNDDVISFYNFKFEIKDNKKINYQPSNKVIKEAESLIIDNNDDFIVINKSSGISVQGGTKSKKNLVDIFRDSEIFFDNKPYTVHRLDKETSGVFIMAKNREYAQLLTSLFRIRKVHKTYLAICSGQLKDNVGTWKNDLIRYEKNKPIKEKAITNFRVLDKNALCSLVQMKPITGRKHQLRKQLSIIGHPIFGDKKYNLDIREKNSKLNLMLHSYEIKFMIKNKKYTYRALLPSYFTKLLKAKRLNFSN